MQYSDNTDSSSQTTSGGEGLALTQPQTASASAVLAVPSEQSTAAAGIDWSDFTTVFFAAGVVINLVMITAYIIWAYRQWDKSGTSDETSSGEG